jgi:hypothetical protein
LAQEDEEEDEGEEPTALAAVEPPVAVIESEPAAEPTEPAAS